MKDIIRKSHDRSQKYGIENDLLFPKRVLKGNELKELINSKQSLIKVALPFLQNIYDVVKGSGFVIILTDGNGCILYITGDSDTVEDARALNMIPGAFMAEDSVGTNAMGLAIHDDKPVQVTAQEHFINAYHRWTCSSAPVHDTEGKIIAVINLTGKYKLVHPHTLGLVVAAVKSIEQQLFNRKLNHKLSDTTSFLNAVINNLSFAILTVNLQGEVTRVNNTTSRTFDIEKEDLIGLHVSKFLPKWEETWKVVSKGERILDEEVTLTGIPRRGSYMMNAMPIKRENSEVHGAVLTFRDMKRVISMVNKYTGMHAHYTFDDIICASGSMHRVIDFARQVADSPSTVLITGASGTGKEVFAQAIHNASSRHDSGFVAVNCGAIPESLFESELFGYDDGAFTGARKGGRPGKFELANEGTLFLDEVGELPLDMQVKLLRVIQEGVVTRVGGSKQIPVDVRIIAATNKELKELVEQNKFRLDLYYRLSVIPLKIPSLADRKEDIPLLIKFFLDAKALKLNRDVPVLEEDVYQMLLRYEWPGNVRELENFIEKTVNLDGKILLDVKDEEEFKMRYLYNTSDKRSPAAGSAEYRLKSLEEVERETIIRTIACCNGNKSRVAKILKISRNTLYLKCKQYGIE